MTNTPIHPSWGKTQSCEPAVAPPSVPWYEVLIPCERLPVVPVAAVVPAPPAPRPAPRAKLLTRPAPSDLAERIRAMYHAGQSPRAISDLLRRLGYAPPSGSKWVPSMVTKILRENPWRGRLQFS